MLLAGQDVPHPAGETDFARRTFLTRMKPMKQNLVSYADLRNTVQPGDLLLWHPSSLVGYAICLGQTISTRRFARYCHASMAAWNHDRLYNLEMTGWYGGRHIPLSRLLKKHPGKCEIWRPKDPLFNGSGAVNQMLWLCGQHYSYLLLMRVAVRQFVPAKILPRIRNRNDPDQPLICSAAYAFAARTGGHIAPCENKFDREVSPQDLALSGFAEYLATPFLTEENE